MSSITGFAGSVPTNYEKYLGSMLFEPYAVDIVDRLNKTELRSILEIACGTGRVTKHLVNALPADGTLTATDLNPDMIAVAQKMISDPRIIWQPANAQELPFEDCSFDAVVCQYGVMFFPDKPKAFAEAYRVLNPGGQYLFNCWSSLERNPAPAIVHRKLIEEFGDAAPRFLEVAPYSFYDHDVIHKLMTDAGFQNVTLHDVALDSHYESTDTVVKGFLDGTPIYGFLQGQDPDRIARVRENIRKELVETIGEESDVVKLHAVVCEGRKSHATAQRRNEKP